MNFKCFNIVILIFSTSLCATSFKGLTLEEFGAVENSNKPLQPDNVIVKGSFRTNDYQNLEQAFDFSRCPVRIGNLYVSSAPYKNDQDPGGPALNYPGSQVNSYGFILTPHDDSGFVFSCKEVNTSNPYIREGKLPSSETFLIVYSLKNDKNKKIIDYNVTGSAYHDIYYQNVTPLILIRNNNPVFIEIAVDGKVIDNPYPGKTLPSGSKWRLKLNNGQTWIFYLEKNDPISFVVNDQNCGLVASDTINGFIRVAIIQSEAVKTISDTTLCKTAKGDVKPPCIDWSTAAEIQSLPANPFNMYLLWPKQWIPKISNQITELISANHFPPSCDVLSQLLPVLAGDNWEKAQSYYKQIPSNNFDNGVNAFTTYFNMLMAQKLSDDINNYQNTYCSYPSYEIEANYQTIETIFDQYRHVIPVFTDVFFDKDGYYWSYTLLEENGDPLVIFPGYKTLSSSYIPIKGYIHKDPIKGPLYAVGAKEKKVSFQVRELPDWFDDFFPSKLQFSKEELTYLEQLLEQACQEKLGISNSYFMGKLLYKFALTAKYGQLVLESLGKSKEEIVNQLSPLINQIKNKFEEWFISRDPDKDYFVGDKTVIGLCATPKGMKCKGCSGEDYFNAIYTDHHFHYGYWLGASAIVIEWDEKYLDPSDAWIAKTKTSNGGVGSHKMKYFVDMLWRDSRNFAKDDINPNNPKEHFIFNRYGNVWEGHSTANGMQCGLYGDGRNQESLAEDFHSWMSTGRYARSILLCSALEAEDKVGFDELQNFSKVNMAMTAGAGKLYYQDNDWIYSGNFAVNVTVGNQYDCKIDQQTFFTPGPVPCIKSSLSEKNTYPSSEEIDFYSEKIAEVFADKINFDHIGENVREMIQMTLDFISSYDANCSKIIKDIVISILYKSVDKIDTSCIQHFVTNYVFKNIISVFVPLFLSECYEQFSYMDDTSLSEEQKSLVYSQELVRKFSHKLAWNELTKVIEYSLGFVIHEKDMSCDQKRYLAKKISNYVIDFTDTIYLPDGFSDPIFKKISNTIIDIIIGD